MGLKSSMSTAGVPVIWASSLGDGNVSPEADPLKLLVLRTVVVPHISCLQNGMEQFQFNLFQVHLNLIPILEKPAQS